jgi:plasmid stabilization system protein ParE
MERVIWSRKAQADADRIYKFLVDKSERAAMDAFGSIIERINAIQAMPHLDRPLQDGTGRREINLRFGAGGYVIVYIISKTQITILSVKHSREARIYL